MDELVFWTRGVDVLAYAILGNHYHGLVDVEGSGFSEPLPRLHTV